MQWMPCDLWMGRRAKVVHWCVCINGNSGWWLCWSVSDLEKMDSLPSELLIKLAGHLNVDGLCLFASTNGGVYAASKVNAMERAKVIIGGCERGNTDLVGKVDPSKFARNLFILDAGERKAKLESYANKCKYYLALLENEMGTEEDFNDRVSQLHKRYHFKNIVTKNKLKKVEDIICFAAAGDALAGLDVVSEVEDSDEDEDESEHESDGD